MTSTSSFLALGGCCESFFFGADEVDGTSCPTFEGPLAGGCADEVDGADTTMGAVELAVVWVAKVDDGKVTAAVLIGTERAMTGGSGGGGGTLNDELR